MAKYVTVTTVDTYDKIPRVLDLWVFKSADVAYRFAEELARNNRFEFVHTDINNDPIYAQAYENNDGSFEYRTICVKSSSRTTYY